MRVKRSLRVSSALLAVLALCLLYATTAQAAARPMRAGLPALLKASAATSVNANVYLTETMLQPLFQASINQSIPQMVSSALSGMVNQLSAQDKGWALQMADALLQPSATLISLKPEADGLLTTLKISLYPGDPKAITTSVLVGFKVTNTSTIQVTALPLPDGDQSLVSGPLTTFTVPIGSLISMKATPQCGDANLSISLKFPVTLSQASSPPTATPAGNSANVQPTGSHATGSASTLPLNTRLPAGHATNSYIELPATSLAQLGGSFGTIQVSSSLTAQNIRVGVQGSNLLVTSDIYWHGFNVGTAVSTMLPGAANGNLVVHVTKTDLQIGFLSFPLNSYNQQIQQTLNTDLNGALAGTFYVNQATIGFTSHVTCTATDSLVLAGDLLAG